MSLTQQFLLISILPLSLLGMIVYLWFRGEKRRKVLIRWTFVLLATAVWASSVLRFYAGINFPSYLIVNWAILGKYAFSFAALCLLLTTARYMFVPSGSGRGAIATSGILWLLALALDPAVWPYTLPDFALAGRNIQHFHVWAAVWATSWLVPILAAWMLTQQVNRSLPRSLYRNQIRYWVLVIIIFGVGGILASNQQPAQPFWQEIAILTVMVAMLIGTISLSHAQLPDIQMAARQLLYRLSGTLIIFALTWLALTLIVRSLPNLPAETDSDLVLVLIAAVLAATFMIINKLVSNITKRIFLPSKSKREAALVDYAFAIGNFPEPAQLGQFVLRFVQSEMGVDDGWLLMAEDGAAGVLILRPLSYLNGTDPETAVFAADSPFADYLRHQSSPLSQYDVDALELFDGMAVGERHVLDQWQRVLYVPLHTGSALIGVMGLGYKRSGASYEKGDFEKLMVISEQISPLLRQVSSMAALQRLNDYVFQQNQTLVRERQHLQETIYLYNQYVNLITPELKRPFAPIDDHIAALQTRASDNPELQAQITDLNRHITEIKNPLAILVNLASRVQVQQEVNLQLVQIDDITQNAIRGLKTMADARRVTITFNPEQILPPVYGSPDQLQEAAKYIIHNAVKFNKIGGTVNIHTALYGGDVVLQVQDTGVGIPEERMDDLWQGLKTVHVRSASRKLPGMGLALARFIVTAHGGRITAESSYGTGSTFTIYLPAIFAD
jgi:signal transduction histidine kinase